MVNLKKIYDYILMFFLSFLVLLAVSIFAMGWNLSVGNISKKEMDFPTAEVKIVGKAYDSSMRLSYQGSVFFLDCQFGSGNLCNKFHGETLYAQNIKVLNINDKVSILIYGEFLESSGEITVIDNLKNIDILTQQVIDQKRSYSKIFFWISLIMFPFVLLGRFYHKFSN